MNDRCLPAEGSITNSTALLEAYIPELRRFARALLRGDKDRADDLMQDSLERAIARWDQRRPDASLRNWLYAIVYHRFVTDRQHRLNQSKWLRPLSPTLEEDLPVSGGQVEAMAYRDLLRGFAKLHADQRAVLFLVGVQDLSYAEVAGILNIPIGTVMSRLSRGRERLRQQMESSQHQIGSARRPTKREHASPMIAMLLTECQV